MNKWSIIGLLSGLGLASFAHAHATSVQTAVRTLDVASQHAVVRAPDVAQQPRGKALRLASLECGAPQLVRPDQGLGAYQDVPATGGIFSLLVWNSPQCGSALSENADMITNLTLPEGLGNLTASYTVQPNRGPARTAIITATGSSGAATFEVRQAAGANAPVPLTNDASVLGAQRTCRKVAITTVKSGATLKPDTWVLSPSRQYKLIYQPDGNLVLYRASGEFVWNNGKTNQGGLLKMQTDGNLVSYDAANKPLWATNTSKKPGAFLGVQDDGNAVVYAVDSCTPLWSSR